jgi:hypothetical protein
MCRVGRRLYIKWFTGLDEDGRMYAIAGMPDAMRLEVIEAFKLETVMIPTN